MDDARFDDLARSLAPASSRRRLAAGLAGGLLALAAPWFGSTTEIAEARKKKRRRKRRRCRPRCGGGHVCKRGRCVCPRGDKPCGGACIPANRCCDDGDCPDIEPVCCRGRAWRGSSAAPTRNARPTRRTSSPAARAPAAGARDASAAAPAIVARGAAAFPAANRATASPASATWTAAKALPARATSAAGAGMRASPAAAPRSAASRSAAAASACR